MGKKYSPTATGNFGQCQTLWALQQNGWHTDEIGYPNIAMSVGTGIHHAAHLTHQGIKEGKAPEAEAVVAEAVAEGTKGIQRLIEAGAFPMERIEDWKERVTDQVTRGSKAYMTQFPKLFESGWIVESSEEAYGAERGQGDYTGRLDLLLRGEFGLAVADVKTKQPFKTPFYRELFLGQFKHSWQMYSYMHMVKEYTGELPARFYLVMVEMKQRPVVEIFPYHTDEVFYQRWLHAATERWAKMEAIENGEAVPTISDNHFFYGRNCPFKRACLDLGCDEGQMKNHGYIQIEGSDG